jgi:dephospho-CoA kinase
MTVLVLGLTGSVAMGKSTTAAMFARRGVPVHDADAAVRRLYEERAVAAVEAAFPGVVADGRIDRERLSARVLGAPGALAKLEAIVHPLVRESEVDFLKRARSKGARIVLLDIPLLLETDNEHRVNAIVVTTADPDTQRRRALARPGMDAERLAAILARQMPDSEKRRRAHFVVDTANGMKRAEHAVAGILRALAFAA